MIENAVFIGMGALGMMFGKCIRDNAGAQAVAFLMDEQRRNRHAQDRYVVNGEEVSYRVVTPSELTAPADLVVFAVKGGSLADAIALSRAAVGPDTVIISLLNGISSEERIRQAYPENRVLDCVAIGMDAMRVGSELNYTQMGWLQIGSSVPGQEDALEALGLFFDRCRVPYEVCGDIRRAMWNKFMINVGTNQTCMVHQTTYGGSLDDPAAFEDMKGAMFEVIALARAEGIDLSESDFEKSITIMRNLAYDGYPSMRQDAVAGRKTEVDLFAGTVVALAKKHGISVPVNEKYLRAVRQMESDL